MKISDRQHYTSYMDHSYRLQIQGFSSSLHTQEGAAGGLDWMNFSRTFILWDSTSHEVSETRT